MCEEPEFDLPGPFIDSIRQLDSREKSGELMIEPDADTRALLNKIAGQTGFCVESVARALLCEALTIYREKGFIF